MGSELRQTVCEKCGSGDLRVDIYSVGHRVLKISCLSCGHIMTPTPSPPAEAEAVVRRLMSFIIDEGEWGGPSINLSDLHVSDFVDAIATIRTLTTAREQSEALLSDPNAVHANMLRGTIAKPSIEQIEHLYPEIREAREQAEQRSLESQMLAHKWMEAHDKLAAGKPYSFPSPADLPVAIKARQAAEARATALEDELQKHRMALAWIDHYEPECVSAAEARFGVKLTSEEAARALAPQEPK